MKQKFTQAFESVKSRCFSKKSVAIYSLIFIIVLSSLLSGGSESLFNMNDLIIIVTMLVSLVLIFVRTPSWFCINNTDDDEDKPQPSVFIKILSVWVPFCLYLMAQVLVLILREMPFDKPNISLGGHLLVYIALCALILVWIIMCACIYFATGSVYWYFAGILAINIAPILISYECYEIYNSASLLVPNKNWQAAGYNPFVALSGLIQHPVIFILILVSVIAALMYLSHQREGRRIINSTAIAVVYKIAVICLISLSFAFIVVGEPVASKCIFMLCGVAVAGLGTYFAFRKKGFILSTAITVSAVVISSVLILELIPARVENEAYSLPNSEEIESVEIFLDSIERFKIDAHFEDCVELHEMLLDLFDKGYLQGETEEPYKKPKCIADLWNDAGFTYKLKDGDVFHRHYKRLNDSAFDEFYIDLMQSDMYIYSFEQYKNGCPSMEYTANDKPKGGWCELPEGCVAELLDTYCNELKSAETDCFYEGYETIRLDGANYEFDRIIYVPLSFKETRRLAEEYIKAYSVKFN